MPPHWTPLARHALVSSAVWLAPSTTAPLPPDPRILLIRPDHLGDVLLASPGVAALRAALPEARLFYLVGPWALETARRGPPVDRLRPCPVPGFTRRPQGAPWSPYVTLLREAARLRGERFDLAVILRPDHWWGALLALAAGIPRRVGYQTALTAPLLTEALPLPSTTHQVELGLRLAAHVAQRCPHRRPVPDPPPPVTFRVFTSDEAAAEALLEREGLRDRPLLVVHPGSGSPLKAWPAERWALAAEALAAERDLALVLTGSAAERPLAEAIARQTRRRAVILAGETPLGTLAALLRRAELVLGTDSGPLHLAAAVGTPTLRLYGPTDPRLFGPWEPRPSGRHRVVQFDLPCIPCGNLAAPPCGALELPPCMLGIRVEQVLAAQPLPGEGG